MRSIKKSLKTAAEAAGLDGVSAHIIRHSVGSFLVTNGSPMTVVRDHLGHADFRMTSRYSHSPTEDQTKAANSLAEVLFLKEE